MQAVRNGLLAMIGLLALYALTMTILTRSWEATLEQFQALWWLMVPLAAGFGIQVGLYAKLRRREAHLFAATATALAKGTTKTERGLDLGRRENQGVPTKAPVVGGISASVGMLACCTHHATDVLPLLGLSGLSLFLSVYQIPLLILSLAINIAGIGIMTRQLRKIHLTQKFAAA